MSGDYTIDTLRRVIDWILHPFSHLSGHHSVLNHASHDLNHGVDWFYPQAHLAQANI